MDLEQTGELKAIELLTNNSLHSFPGLPPTGDVYRECASRRSGPDPAGGLTPSPRAAALRPGVNTHLRPVRSLTPSRPSTCGGSSGSGLAGASALRSEVNRGRIQAVAILKPGKRNRLYLLTFLGRSLLTRRASLHQQAVASTSHKRGTLSRIIVPWLLRWQPAVSRAAVHIWGCFDGHVMESGGHEGTDLELKPHLQQFPAS